PTVGDDDQQRIRMLRTNVDEMNVEAVDLGEELRQRVQPRFALAPVVLRRPVSREGLSRCELHALRCVRDRLAIGPPCRVDAPPQFGEFRFRNTYMKRTDRSLVSRLLAAFLCRTR